MQNLSQSKHHTKRINKYILVLFSIILVLVVLVLNDSLTSKIKANTMDINDKNDYVIYKYTITEIEQNHGKIEYYGRSKENDTGIYFIDDKIQKGEIINQGDTIKAFFDSGNKVDGLLYVKTN